MASLPVRDPVGDQLLTPQNAALLVIDYQPSQFEGVNSCVSLPSRLAPRACPRLGADGCRGSSQIGAELYERSEDRTAHRNRYRTRTWDTRVGTVELRVPKVAPGPTSPSCSNRVGARSGRSPPSCRRPT
jgi:hypothetical protein